VHTHRLRIHLDNRRAGHAYLELVRPGQERGEVYGYYPERYGEKREVLIDRGEVRKDRSRLDDVRQTEGDRLITKSIELHPDAFARLTHYLEEQMDHPSTYLLVGSNCIDFIQQAYSVGVGEGRFLELYTPDELKRLSWVGVYGRLLRGLL
jgi:hypothetical protein